jgi:hypothetical protein
MTTLEKIVGAFCLAVFIVCVVYYLAVELGAI